MKKILLWLMVVGAAVCVLLVAWEVVAKPGPLRLAWWNYKMWRNPVYEAAIKFTTERPLTDDELAAENQLLDSMTLLMPLVQELELAKEWGTPDDTAAMVRLAQQSGFRRGNDELDLLLTVQDSNRELIGRIIEPLARSYRDKKLEQMGIGNEFE